MAKESWSKELGYDLRYKRVILKNELRKSGGASSVDLPKIPVNQIHANRCGQLVHTFYDANKKYKSHKKLKAKISRKLAKLPQLAMGERGVLMRKIEGMIYYVLTHEGTLNEVSYDF